MDPFIDPGTTARSLSSNAFIHYNRLRRKNQLFCVNSISRDQHYLQSIIDYYLIT